MLFIFHFQTAKEYRIKELNLNYQEKHNVLKDTSSAAKILSVSQPDYDVMSDKQRFFSKVNTSIQRSSRSFIYHINLFNDFNFLILSQLEW